jgi:hypothetical protein
MRKGSPESLSASTSASVDPKLTVDASVERVGALVRLAHVAMNPGMIFAPAAAGCPTPETLPRAVAALQRKSATHCLRGTTALPFPVLPGQTLRLRHKLAGISEDYASNAGFFFSLVQCCNDGLSSPRNIVVR